MSGDFSSSEPAVTGLNDAIEKIISLRRGRPGTVVGSLDDSNPFMDALYVPDIVDETAASLLDAATPEGKLLVLLGSAGDGKTAIFGRAYRHSSQAWLEKEHLNLDATASSDFGETETGDLEQFLTTARDGLGTSGEPNRGLAINLGIALKFFATAEMRETYPDIWGAIDAARSPDNFTNGYLYEDTGDTIVANLSHRRLFNTHPDMFGAGLLDELVRKFDYSEGDSADDASSPLASIASEIEEAADQHPVAYNIAQLSEPDVRDSITDLLAARALLSNQYLNPRRVLHYLSHILIPQPLVAAAEADGVPTFSELEADGAVRVAETLLWNSTYNVLTQRDEENVRLDPCVVASLELDEMILQLNTHTEWELPETGCVLHDGREFTRTHIRRQHLIRESGLTTEERSQSFRQFTGARTRMDSLWTAPDKTNDAELKNTVKNLIGEASELVIAAIKRWSQQSPDEESVTIADGKPSTAYRFMSEWDGAQATPDKPLSQRKTSKETQLGKLWFAFANGVAIPLSYELYRLLMLIVDGYNPDAVDPEESEGVRLIHSQLSQFSKKDKQLDVRDAGGRTLLRVREGTGWDEGIDVSK